MPIKGVIFDHDGTLVDSEKIHFQIWRELLQEYQVNFSEAEYIRYHSGVPSHENASKIINTHELNHTPKTLCLEKEQLTKAYFSKHDMPLMPFAEECVQYCHQQQLKIAVATGANKAVVESSLGHLTFYSKFSVIATREDVERAKPAPDVYLLALSRLNLGAAECVAIEDSPTGIAAAKAAGLTCIAVPNNYSKHQRLNRADYRTESLGGVIRLIEKMI